MTELSFHTDLDTLDSVDKIMLHEQIEKLGILRTDLKALIDYTHSLDLSSSLKSIGVKKVLEIGTGARFEALISIHKAFPELPIQNIWAVDPKMDLDVWPDQKPTVDKITKKRTTLQKIIGETSGKFDLILNKGVISIGAGITTQDSSILEEILDSVRQSLNSHNRKAIAIISSKTGLLLPFGSKLLQSVGLNPVYFMAPTNFEDFGWGDSLQEIGAIDTQPFKLVVCQREK